MSMILAVFAVSIAALAKSVDQLPPDDEDNERDTSAS